MSITLWYEEDVRERYLMTNNEALVGTLLALCISLSTVATVKEVCEMRVIGDPSVHLANVGGLLIHGLVEGDDLVAAAELQWAGTSAVLGNLPRLGGYYLLLHAGHYRLRL